MDITINEDADGWSRSGSEQPQESFPTPLPDTSFFDVMRQAAQEARDRPPIRLEGFRGFGDNIK